jgi:transposase
MKNTNRKRYSAEFKSQAIELVKLGKPVPEVAQELDIGSGILYRWTLGLRNHPQPAQLGSEGLRAVGEQAEADELRRLRRENAHLRLENDILKKAAVILGTDSQPQHRHAR